MWDWKWCKNDFPASVQLSPITRKWPKARMNMSASRLMAISESCLLA